MITNYELQQYFLDIIKQFSISNPDKNIHENFIYSQLIGFNIQNNQGPYQDVIGCFCGWLDRYKQNRNINVFNVANRPGFLWFSHGKIKGNEIKLYIPLDKNHLKEGANQLFDFISTTGIVHQSKIADIIRNDNVVVRVTTMEDAKTIIDYVHTNPYLKEGLMKVNPFLPTCNGVGITMDNNFSYNMTVCTVISEFLNLLKQHNRLDLFTVVELNKYIKSSIANISDLDLKDIYSLLARTTDPNFKLQDFVDHANYKLSDKYTSNRERIVDPEFYFEQAIKITNTLYPQNTKTAILEYLKGNPNYFTNREKARDGLIKYVHPGDVINLMRTKLNQNNIQIPNSDNELVDNYLSILLNKELKKDIDRSFEIIKTAYINTLNKYNYEQARTAIKTLLLTGEIHFFTNQFGDRKKLKELMMTKDVRKIILANINIENLDINNVDEIVNRFEEIIKENSKTSQNAY